MDRIDIWLKGAATVAAGAWGGLIAMVQLLLILMVLDIFSGMLAAAQKGELSSQCSFRGMTKKAMILLVVASAGAIECYVPESIGAIPLQASVAGFYSAGEVLSILENAVAAGLPVPQFLREALAKLSPEKLPERPTQ